MSYIILGYTRKLPPSAGFPSPSGGVAPLAPPLGAFGDTVRAPAAPSWTTAAFGGGERKYLKKNWGACSAHLGNRRLWRR